MQTLIAAILVFGLIITVHEFGHYLFAKLTGIRVEEFAVGMGPKLVSKKWGETVYSLRLIPMGGYCRMTGETGEEAYQPTEKPDPRRFDQKPALVRLAVAVGGPLMNFLLAFVIFSLIFVMLGVPEGYTTQIGQVLPGKPAEAVGLQAGDRIIDINGQPVDSWDEMVELIHQSAGKELQLTVNRDGQELKIAVIPELDQENKVGLIGITPQEPKWRPLGVWAGIGEGLKRTYEFTSLTLQGLLQMVTGQASSADIAGPVGIVNMIGESARFGLIYLANLTALISISLGLFNLLPIPALDGGRLLFILIEIIRGRPVNPARENMVHLIGFALLLILMMLVTYRDILRLLG